MAEYAAEESARTCPICLDEASRQTITVCGHHFCSDCIHECAPSQLKNILLRPDVSRSL